MDNMKTQHNIGFEVLKKDKDVVVLKRVLPMKNGKRRKDVEMSLPKLSVHYFDTEELQHLQEIALQISKRKVECPHCKEISYITHVQKNEKFENILFTCPYCGTQRNLTVYRVQN